MDEGWPKETVDTLLACVDEGMTASQIGRIIGKTRNAVCGRLFRMEAKLRSGATGGVGNNTDPWTKQEIEQLRAAHGEGKTCAQARQILTRRSQDAIWRKSRDLGLGPWVRRPEPPKRAVLVKLPEPEPLGAPEEFLPAGKVCNWIVGDPLTADWRMCGHELGGHKRWCPAHAFKGIDRSKAPLTRIRES
jgi:hypothetical protein